MTFPISTVDAAIILALGESMTYTPDGGSPTPISAYFQSPNEVPEGGELEFELQGPRVHALSTVIPNPSHLDQFIINGVTYRVSHILQDEGSLVELMLERL